jgi:hypothetical protein
VREEEERGGAGRRRKEGGEGEGKELKSIQKRRLTLYRKKT